MFEELIVAMRKEPIASALFLMATLYYILKSTGLWDWLPNKIYGDKTNFKTKCQNNKQ